MVTSELLHISMNLTMKLVKKLKKSLLSHYTLLRFTRILY